MGEWFAKNKGCCCFPHFKSLKPNCGYQFHHRDANMLNSANLVNSKGKTFTYLSQFINNGNIQRAGSMIVGPLRWHGTCKSNKRPGKNRLKKRKSLGNFLKKRCCLFLVLASTSFSFYASAIWFQLIFPD